MEDLLSYQRKILHEKTDKTVPQAFTEVSEPPQVAEEAEQKFARKEVACVILAGGMGSRLQKDLPKGCIPLPKYGDKTLFDILLEKAGDMPVAVMASPLNLEKTREALKKYHVELFSQDVMPLLSMQEEWIEDLAGPDGNGSVFAHLKKSGILDTWRFQGIRYLTIVPVDNPKANPRNLEQVAALSQVELVVTAIEKGQNTGTLVIRDRCLHVAEYMDEPIDGPYAYSGLFACSIDFAERASEKTLPWHVVKKYSANQPVWKFEHFIFDLFPLAKSYKVIFQPRSECFAPIKTQEDL